MRLLSGLLPLCIALGACGVKKEIHQKCVDTLAQRESDLAALQKKYGIDVDAEAKKLAALRGDKENVEKELDDLRKQKAKDDERLAAFRDLRDRLKKLTDTGKLEVAFRDGQMILKLPSEILFPSGKAKLSKEGEVALNDVLKILIDFKDRKFMVAGHTDNVPIKSGQFPNNWILSTARAVSVVLAMVETGFPPNGVIAAGMGEFAPVASNDDPAGREKNRRIEIVLLPNLSDLPNLD